MADGTKGDDTAAGAPPPRDTYVPKPPSKEEVDQVSREQGMISDEWTGGPQTGDSKTGGGGAPRREG